VTKVISLGLGPIGLGIARALIGKADIEIVGAVDASDALVGRNLGELLQRPAVGLIVSQDLEAALQSNGNGVVVQATASRLADIAPQLEAIIGCGWNAVSTSEELADANADDSTLSRQLDRAAAEAGVTVLGAGVNPGFLMDVLPLLLTGLCLQVDSISVHRIVDTNARRVQLQEKVGVGMSEGEFEARASAGRLGHVGLRQSAHLIAETLGWGNPSYEESLLPVVASEDTATPIGSVRAGDVLGQRQVATLSADGTERLRLTLEMYAGASGEDRIEIRGEPSIRQAIAGGVNGDIATAALICNLVSPVERARPGLLTMADLLPLACVPASGIGAPV
jgi:hypothetical protein